MTATTVLTPEALARRQERLLRAVPYGMLAVSIVLVAVADDRSPGQMEASLALTVAAAAWMVLPLRRWTDRPVVGAVYYAGLVGLSAAMVACSPVFGLFAWTGYPQIAYLRGRLQWAGMAATAFVVSATYVGGFGGITAATLPLYLAFAVVTTALGAAFTHFAQKQSAMVEALSRANAMLEEALEENAGLHAQLLVQAREAGVLDERQRMAREIHDTLAQGFTGIVAQLEAARHNPGEWRRYAEQAQALARDNLAEARRSVEALRPPHLEHARLPEAISGMAERWSAGSGVPAGVETTGRPRPMLPDIEVALFRVAQEALTNVGKHAKASRVGLTLSYLEDVVLLDVRDDGVGFEPEPESPGGGFGLRSMRQRMARVAGTLAVESVPGEGTAVNATVPAIPAGAES